MTPTNQARSNQNHGEPKEQPGPGVSGETRIQIDEPEESGEIVSLAERRRMQGAKKGMFNPKQYGCWFSGAKSVQPW